MNGERILAQTPQAGDGARHGMPAIDLTRNENPFFTWGPDLLPRLQGIVSEIHAYPSDGALPLRSDIARRHGWQADSVVLGNGSSEVLQLLIRAASCRHPRHARAVRLLTSGFTFPLYGLIAQAEGIAHSVVPSLQYGHDIERIAGSAGTDAIVILDNPCNPSGTLLTLDQIDWLARTLGPDCWLVVDEAYIEYAEEQGSNSADVLLGIYPNLVVVRTFSKAFGMAGGRLGYALCSRPMAEAMNRFRLKFNLNSLAVAMGLSALSREAEMRAGCTLLVQERRRMEGAIRSIGAAATCSSAGFVFVENNMPGRRLLGELQSANVRVALLPHHDGRLRISIGACRDNDVVIQAALRVLAK